MPLDLRRHLRWEAVAASPDARSVIIEWTAREPSESMRFAVPLRGQQWAWQLLDFFAPHSMPDAARCTVIESFSAPNEAAFARHAPWLAQVRPSGVDRVLVLLRDFLFDVTWAEFAQCFAPLATHCVAFTGDMRWMALGYHDEFIVCFRPEWDAIESIIRIRSTGPVAASNERAVFRCRDGSTWESGRAGNNLSADTIRTLASVSSLMTGLSVEEAAC